MSGSAPGAQTGRFLTTSAGASSPQASERMACSDDLAFPLDVIQSARHGGNTEKKEYKAHSLLLYRRNPATACRVRSSATRCGRQHA